MTVNPLREFREANDRLVGASSVMIRRRPPLDGTTLGRAFSFRSDLAHRGAVTSLCVLTHAIWIRFVALRKSWRVQENPDFDSTSFYPVHRANHENRRR